MKMTCDINGQFTLSNGEVCVTENNETNSLQITRQQQQFRCRGETARYSVCRVLVYQFYLYLLKAAFRAKISEKNEFSKAKINDENLGVFCCEKPMFLMVLKNKQYAVRQNNFKK